jgi:ribosome-associated toxin RatA of RatAB toxin-antitoxin module
MEKICRSALIPYSAKQMFDLVDDIDSYPSFVPYCQGSKTIERSDTQVTAELQVAKSGIAKAFTTRNALTPSEKIEMTLVDGPFNHLMGGWNFIALSEDACKIELVLEFEFKNKLAKLAFSGLFHKLIDSMVKAFTDRASVVYGK